jgi:hypothetical protein
MKLSDQVIAEICRQLQVAIITGTDVVDNLRLMQLEETEDGVLGLTDEYAVNAEANIEKMLAEAEQRQASTEATADE